MSAWNRRRRSWGTGDVPEQEYWLSYSDLLASLLLVFALMLAVALANQGRSAQRPSCRATGIISGPLFSVTVTAVNRFEISGRPFNLAGVRKQYGADLQAAERAGCVHSIRIYYAAGLSLEDYHVAANRLKQNFYAAELGRR